MLILSVGASIIFILLVIGVWFLYNCECEKEHKHKPTKKEIKLQKQGEELVQRMTDYFSRTD